MVQRMVQVAAMIAASTLGLARPPYIGVACRRVPNLTTCGRIGIGVWLKRPARGVDAALSRAHVRLHAGGFGGTGPTYWEGYVRVRKRDLPRGWYGGDPPFFLRLRINLRYPTGTARGTVRVLLHPGWG